MKVLIIFVIFLLSGCSTTAYYKTQQNRYYHIDEQESVFILEPTKSNMEDKNFAKLLSHTLKNNGFKLSESAKCGFTFSLQEPTYKNVGSYTIHNSYGGYTSSIPTPQIIYYTYNTKYKNIYLDFACLDANNTLEHIWEGFASATLDEYNANKEKMIDNLVVLAVDNYEAYDGSLSIGGNQNVRKFLQKERAKNMILIGSDVGIGLLQGKMNDRISLSLYGYYDDITSVDNSLNIPLNIRVGYLRKLPKQYIIGANIVYTKNFSNGMDIETTRNTHSSNQTHYSSVNTAMLKSEQIGIEAVLGMTKSFLLGIGLSKDINSSLTFPINNYPGITKDINALYMPIRLALIGGGVDTDLLFSVEVATSIPLSGKYYIKNQFSFSIGISYPIYLW
ncbi:DUF4136 domain-containing protein [Helicobacter hepaticus]|jgi:hypothetical protein|uniref:DUF4136 domain-containing protein n=1 Tax=Helicobacter hepaticus (strain ATCC 51449 / 3B1) TaxID=235279 RepID=Q7VGT9_HELHP|nr:DUF4136 domain-containing protein [Helicobacter hepaticus]AAP77828.1 hypothetical protein HH_1231 [Helicobacter hepaticus ATCC 51449]